MLREKHTSRIFENMVLRKIFGHMRDEVTGGWSRLHLSELYDLPAPIFTKYYSGYQINKNEMGAACGTRGLEERCILDFGGGYLRERDHLEDLCLDGRIILK